MYKGHCSRESTRQHTVPERIETKRKKNDKKKRVRKKSFVHRNKRWQVIQDQLI
jgi:hypothetical protein